MEEKREMLGSSVSAEESEEGECSSGNEENPSSLPKPAKQVLVQEEIDREGETSEGEKEPETESGNKIKPEKLMQLAFVFHTAQHVEYPLANSWFHEIC